MRKIKIIGVPLDLGMERAVAWICGLEHVRETIPCPAQVEPAPALNLPTVALTAHPAESATRVFRFGSRCSSSPQRRTKQDNIGQQRKYENIGKQPEIESSEREMWTEQEPENAGCCRLPLGGILASGENREYAVQRQ